MAGRIEWKNVEAPDLATAGIRGLSTASDILGKGFTGLQDTLTGIQESQEQNVLKAILAQSIGAEDPGVIDAAMQGQNMDRVSAKGLLGLDAHRASIEERGLIMPSKRQAAVDQEQLTYARPLLAQLAIANQSNDTGRVQALLAENGGTLAQLPTSSLYDAMDNGRKDAVLDINRAEIAGRIQANNMSNQNKVMKDWQDNNLSVGVNAIVKHGLNREQAMTFLPKLASRLGLNASAQADLMKYVQSLPESGMGYQNIDPKWADDLDAQTDYAGLGYRANPFEGMSPSGGMGVTGPAMQGGQGPQGTGAGVGSGAYDVVVGFGKHGLPPRPLSTMKIGDVLSFGTNTLIPRTKAAGIGRDSRGLLGSSASGAFQITGETLKEYAPRVLGKDWQEQVFTADVQEKIAKKIFDERKGLGGGLYQTWRGLGSAANALRVSKMPWEQAKHEIIRGEVGNRSNSGSSGGTTSTTAPAGNSGGERDSGFYARTGASTNVPAPPKSGYDTVANYTARAAEFDVGALSAMNSLMTQSAARSGIRPTPTSIAFEEAQQGELANMTAASAATALSKTFPSLDVSDAQGWIDRVMTLGTNVGVRNMKPAFALRMLEGAGKHTGTFWGFGGQPKFNIKGVENSLRRMVTGSSDTLKISAQKRDSIIESADSVAKHYAAAEQALTAQQARVAAGQASEATLLPFLQRRDVTLASWASIHRSAAGSGLFEMGTSGAPNVTK